MTRDWVLRPAWRPQISTLPPVLLAGSRLHTQRQRFSGISEASGGTSYNSPTNYPLVQLRRLDNEQTWWLRPDPAHPFSAAAFTSVPLAGSPNGHYLATVFANGIPSVSGFTRFGPAPSPPKGELIPGPWSYCSSATGGPQMRFAGRDKMTNALFSLATRCLTKPLGGAVWTRRLRPLTILFLACCCLCLHPGCLALPIPQRHRNIETLGKSVEETKLSFVVPGQTTKAEFIDKVGQPYLMMDDWGVMAYYWKMLAAYVPFVGPSRGAAAGLQKWNSNTYCWCHMMIRVSSTNMKPFVITLIFFKNCQ